MAIGTRILVLLLPFNGSISTDLIRSTDLLLPRPVFLAICVDGNVS